MELYPAIDIMEGHAVRLVKGDFQARKVYDQEPLEAARRWAGEGAERLHVVDLDGARGGEPVNLEHLAVMVSELGLPVQYGGGLRSVESVERALAAGASRVILGTAAFTDPELLGEVLERWPGRVAVSADVRGGLLTTAGWTETTDLRVPGVARELYERGVQELIYTNIDRDGMLTGPDTEELGEVLEEIPGTLIYSGGIGTLDHLVRLRELGHERLRGVIVGKALYEGRFTVAEAVAALSPGPETV